MSSKRVIVRNILWNWSGRLVEAILGFFIAPFLVHQLGETTYGLWIIVASLTGYFGLLDLGVQISVGRFFAFYRARNDQDGVNATFSTAAVLLCGVGALALLVVLGIQLLFFRIFDVPDEAVVSVRWALLLVGLNLALSLVLAVFDSTLWSLQRFDLLNATDTAFAILRAGLTFCLVAMGDGLVALASITLISTLGNGLMKAFWSFRLDPALRFAAKHVKKSVAFSLYSYGIWRIVMAAGRITTTRLNPLIIGAFLNVTLVTPYALASRLMAYTISMFLAARAVLVPLATTYDAKGQVGRQQELMMEGGKNFSVLGLFFLTAFIFLGRPFFQAWAGPDLAYASRLLIILAAGEFLPLWQSATTSVLLGMARHRALAFLTLTEIAAAVALAMLLVGPFGLMGVCVAQAVTAAVTRGVVQAVYACRVLGLPIRQYLVRSLLGPLSAAALPAAGLATIVSLRVPGNWTEILLYGAGYAAAYACSFLVFVGDKNVKPRVVEIMKVMFSFLRA